MPEEEIVQQAQSNELMKQYLGKKKEEKVIHNL